MSDPAAIPLLTWLALIGVYALIGALFVYAAFPDGPESKEP